MVHRQGLDELTPRQLSTQVARTGFVVALAVFPILPVHVPYRNWYGFPVCYTLG